MDQGINNIISSRFGIFYAVVDSNLTVTFTDRRLMEYLNFNRVELSETALSELFPEVVGIENEIHDVITGSRDSISVKRINRTTTGDIYFNLHFFSDSLRAGCSYIVVEDITDSSISFREAQQRRNEVIIKNIELIRREEFINTLLDTIPDPIFYRDAAGRCLGCNLAFEEFSTRKREDIIGRQVTGILNRGEILAEYDDELLERGGVKRYESWIADGSGSERHVIINKSVFFSSGRTSGVIVSAIVDITERKRMEEQLQIFGKAIEQSPAAIIITDETGIIEYINRKFTEITGFSEEDVIGQNPRILKSGFHDSGFYRRLWETITTQGVWYGEMLNRRKNGDLCWELVSISRMKDSSGNITHYIGVEEDITDLKNATRELEKSQAALREKIGIMESNILIARKAVDAMLQKKFPELDNIDIECSYLPLEQIGGDYYAVLPFDGFLGVFICDITGHGIASALFLSLIRYFAEKVYPRTWLNPSEYLALMNREYFRGSSVFYFFSAIAGSIITGEKNEFRFSNGGHPHPILLRENGESVFIGDNNAVIGLFEEQDFSQYRVVLEKGDMLFLYSDGIPATRDEKGSILGFDETLLELFSRSRKNNLKETMNSIINETILYRGGGSQEDDILLLGFHIK